MESTGIDHYSEMHDALKVPGTKVLIESYYRPGNYVLEGIVQGFDDLGGYHGFVYLVKLPDKEYEELVCRCYQHQIRPL